MPLTPLLVDARQQFLKQCVDALAPPILAYLSRVWEFEEGLKPRSQALMRFQSKLREVPHWNSAEIAERVAEIRLQTPHLSQLIAAVLVSYVRVLSSIRLNQNASSAVRLKIPSDDTMIHSVFVDVARDLYHRPQLIRSGTRRELNDMIAVAVEHSVRSVLPTRDLLASYLGGSVVDDTMSPDPAGDVDDASPDNNNGGEDDDDDDAAENGENNDGDEEEDEDEFREIPAAVAHPQSIGSVPFAAAPPLTGFPQAQDGARSDDAWAAPPAAAPAQAQAFPGGEAVLAPAPAPPAPAAAPYQPPPPPPPPGVAVASYPAHAPLAGI